MQEKLKYELSWSSFKRRFWKAVNYIRSPKGLASLIITLIGSIIGAIATVILGDFL